MVPYLMGPIARTDLDEIVESTEEVWSALKGGRVFVTGSTGFFGVWLLSAFAHAKTRLGVQIPLTVLTRNAASTRAKYDAILSEAGAEVLEGDARSYPIPPGSFSHFIHGATTSGSQLEPAEMFDVIVSGTRRVLDHARSSGASRFLFMSSGAVYGPQPSAIANVPETYLGGPNTLDLGSAYGEGKRAAETLCAIHAKAGGFGFAVARGFAFVGPHLPLDAHFAIGNFIRDGIKGGPIRISGDGTPYRSYMYGTDLAAWIWTMLASPKANGAYNLGSDDGRPLSEIAARVAAATSTKVEIAKSPTPGAPPSRYVPDASRARNELGVKLRVDLDEGIRRTIAFHTR